MNKSTLRSIIRNAGYNTYGQAHEIAEAILIELESRAAAAPEEHIIREVVDAVRNTAVEFHAHQSLRERLAYAMGPLIDYCKGKGTPAAPVVAEGLDIEAERNLFELSEIQHQQGRHPQEPLTDDEKAYVLRRDPQQRDTYAACGGEWAGWLRRAAIAAHPVAGSPAGAARTVRDEVDWENGYIQLLEQYKHATDHGIMSRESVQARIIDYVLARTTPAAAPVPASEAANATAATITQE